MEIEKKFTIDDKDELARKLLENGFTKKKTTHQEDKYYIVAEMMNRRKTYLRIREDLLSKESRLDFHEVISELATEETEFKIDDPKKAQAVLIKLGHPLKCVVNKKREVYTQEDCTATIDEVAGLGTYLELEIEGDDSKKSSDRLTAIQNLLKLEVKNQVKNIGYPDLLLQAKKADAD